MRRRISYHRRRHKRLGDNLVHDQLTFDKVYASDVVTLGPYTGLGGYKTANPQYFRETGSLKPFTFPKVRTPTYIWKENSHRDLTITPIDVEGTDILSFSNWNE